MRKALCSRQQPNDLVWELVERKNSEDIHKAELPKFLFRVVDFR